MKKHSDARQVARRRVVSEDQRLGPLRRSLDGISDTNYLIHLHSTHLHTFKHLFFDVSGQAFLALLLIYIFLHYIFASQAAHISALYLPFVAMMALRSVLSSALLS